MKLRKLVMVLMVLLMVSSFAMADEFAGDTAPPGRMGRGGNILMDKTLSIGLYIAYHLSETIEVDGKEVSYIETDDKFGGLSAKFFFLMNGKLGATVDATFLGTIEDSYGDTDTWMFDFGVAYRTMLTRKLMVIGGLGWSQYFYNMTFDDGSDDESDWGDKGWYAKAGVEYFLGENITVGGSFKWTTFDLDEDVKFKYLNFELSVNYYL